MFGNINAPPPIEAYEMAVRPVSVAARAAPLSERNRGRPTYDRRRTKRRNRKTEADEKLFEPCLGKLLDFTA